jgi:hypothetical protein
MADRGGKEEASQRPWILFFAILISSLRFICVTKVNPHHRTNSENGVQRAGILISGMHAAHAPEWL